MSRGALVAILGNAYCVHIEHVGAPILVQAQGIVI